MDRWTFTFVAALALAISATNLTGASELSPSAINDVPVKTSWPSLAKPTPVTP